MIEKFLSKKRIYQGRAVNFAVDTVRLPDGHKATREYLDHPGAAAVLPFLDAKTVVLVRQYRHPVREVTWEIPAGKLIAGEDHRACLNRELREETGYSARTLRKLVDYWPTPAFSNEVIRIFWAKDLTAGAMSPDEDEFISAEAVPFAKVLRWIRDGKIRDSKTVIAALSYDRFIAS